MEPEESTAPPAYQSLVRSLSERSLGYLERMRRADFGYQTMASREDGGGSFVSSAPSLKRRPSPQDSIPTLKRDSSARSGLDSFTSVTQDRRWEPKYSKRVERVSGVGLPPHLYKSRLQHVFTLAPRFSSPRLGQGIAGSLGPGAYAGSIIQPAKAELPGTAGGQLRKKRHSSMIELPVGSTGALGPGSYNPQPLQSRSVGHLDFGRGKRKMAPPASYVAPGTYDPPDVAGRQLQQPGQSGYTFGGDERDLMSYVKVRVEAGPGSYHPRFDPLSLRHRPSAACSGKETSYGLSADSDSGPAGGAAGPSVGPGTVSLRNIWNPPHFSLARALRRRVTRQDDGAASRRLSLPALAAAVHCADASAHLDAGWALGAGAELCAAAVPANGTGRGRAQAAAHGDRQAYRGLRRVALRRRPGGDRRRAGRGEVSAVRAASGGGVAAVGARGGATGGAPFEDFGV